MDIYALDSNYRKEHYIDDFESLIWKEAYDEKGEIQIVTEPASKAYKYLVPGRAVMHSESNKIMIIDYALKRREDDGRLVYDIRGSSGEYMLNLRAVGSNDDNSTMNVGGTPAWIAQRIVQKICVNAEDIYELDKIPHLYRAVDLSNHGVFTRVEIKPQSLYSAVVELCKSDDLGFSIVRNESNPPTLEFQVYKGVDRSKSVIFSSKLDNLAQEQHLSSTANYFNVAYVWAKDNHTRYTVYAPGFNATNATGLNRRILHVDAHDLDPAKLSVNDLRTAMTQRGLEKLAEKPRIDIFDGVITPYTQFKYRQDYFLGDTVTFISDESDKQYKQVVTEYIWAQDREGERSYPTFTAKDAR